MELHILDASSYIWAAYMANPNGRILNRGVREIEGEWVAASFPIHPVLYLLRTAYDLTNDNSTVMICFDRTPTIKRQMYTDCFGDFDSYKGNRDVEPRIRANIKFQKELAEACCNKAGLWVQAAEGYEADDLIYTLVEMNKEDYSHVYVHTRDSDLSFLVSDNVSIAKLSDNVGKSITLENYFYTARNKKTTEYNTVHLNKLIKGDSADNIPGIGNDWANYINKYITPDITPKLGDLNFARSILRKAVKDGSDKVNSHKVIPTFNILVPLVVPYELIDVYEHEPDMTMIRYYFLDNFNPQADSWDCESLVEEYLDKYMELDFNSCTEPSPLR